jgi:hypothetical protein
MRTCHTFFRTCSTISILFPTQCHLFHNSVFFLVQIICTSYIKHTLKFKSAPSHYLKIKGGFIGLLQSFQYEVGYFLIIDHYHIIIHSYTATARVESVLLYKQIFKLVMFFQVTLPDYNLLSFTAK